MRARVEQSLQHLLAVWMQFVLDWGYVGIFLMMAAESTAVPIPAEVILPPAAFWAAQGKLNIFLIVLVATAGSWFGSAASWWIAYKAGRPLFERYGRYVLLPHATLARADAWFDEYGTGGIFVARLLPGIRHLISIPAGLFHMNFRKFSLMTILGAGLYNGALTWWGMRVLGDQPALMHDPTALRHALSAKMNYLIGFAVVVAVLYGVMSWMQHRAAASRKA
jgi:membrane protein DedA with SNARE-associated domain